MTVLPEVPTLLILAGAAFSNHTTAQSPTVENRT